MADPFMGQILFAGFGFAPRQYAACDGGVLQITQYGALFALIGKAFGGNGTTTFMLPDLRGRTPSGAVVSIDTKWSPPPTVMGAASGSETVQLTPDQIPSHSHSINVTTDPGDSVSLSGSTFGTADNDFYAPPSTLVGLTGSPMSNVGANASHDNMQPFAVIEAAIALAGIYPPRA